MIIVKRDSDGKIFTTNVSMVESIYEIYFYSDHTRVTVREIAPDTATTRWSHIICKPTVCRQSCSDVISYTGTLGWFL